IKAEVDRRTKSLRKKSERPVGGQSGREGTTRKMAIRDTLNLDNGKALRYYTLAFIQIRYINLTFILIVTASDSF
ncbi:MAG: hypothetical protein K2L56_06970, partial [Prevotella sp.]|nr:hypothetical protein [Prevotella sp.]